MAFPPFGNPTDSLVRPGFDVLMAVTGARQSASITARRVAANRVAAHDPASAEQRRQLLAYGRMNTAQAAIGVARFADVGPIATATGTNTAALATDMNGLFTRAFQPLVKHADVYPQHKVGRVDGAGLGSK